VPPVAGKLPACPGADDCGGDDDGEVGEELRDDFGDVALVEEEEADEGDDEEEVFA
jgi:hypothetical protein